MRRRKTLFPRLNGRISAINNLHSPVSILTTEGNYKKDIEAFSTASGSPQILPYNTWKNSLE